MGVQTPASAAPVPQLCCWLLNSPQTLIFLLGPCGSLTAPNTHTLTPTYSHPHFSSRDPYLSSNVSSSSFSPSTPPHPLSSLGAQRLPLSPRGPCLSASEPQNPVPSECFLPREQMSR